MQEDLSRIHVTNQLMLKFEHVLNNCMLVTKVQVVQLQYFQNMLFELLLYQPELMLQQFQQLVVDPEVLRV